MPIYISDETITCDDRDPPWINKDIKQLILDKNHAYKLILCRPLKIIFQSCLESGKFPIEWKKANVVPVHKKGDKQRLKNCRTISLLPTAGKIFERLFYDRMFVEVFSENKLISKNQSGFLPGNFCINQLLSITHEIYQSFHDSLEVRTVFLDISKALDKI